MCVVSNMGDQWAQDFPNRWPTFPVPPGPVYEPFDPVTREEFDELRKEIMELRLLLQAAKRFDEATGQPDCEADDKIELIKKVAAALDVDLEDLFD